MYVPQYEGIGLREMADYLGNSEVLLQYLPITKEMRTLPRQWIINAAYTIVGNPFKDWIRNRIEARNVKVAVEKNMMINIDPGLSRIWQNSTAVSRKNSHISIFSFTNLLILDFLLLLETKGTSVNLLKLGTKRRRTKQEITDEQEEARIKQETVEAKLEDYERLKEQHNALNDSQRDEIAASFVLQDLLKKG